VAGTVAIPATVAGAAAPSKIWVNGSATAVGGTGRSCALPGYNSIQTAINNAGNFGATIEVCTGTYVEQLTITNSVNLVSSGGPVTVQLPSTPADNATSCDAALSSPGQDEISICGAGNVGITNITVSAYWPANTCYDNMTGVFVGQGSSLSAKGLTVSGAGVPLGDPDVGCQGGVGVRVGTAYGAGQVASAVLKNTTVTGYQKAGIVVSGTGSSMTVTTATVTGRGPVGTAENGIEVVYGASGSITGATVSDNQCVLAGACGSDALLYSQASGILFYGAAAGSLVTKSTFTSNDMGIYYGSTANTVPASPDVSISRDTVTSSVDEGIQLDAGKASLTHDTVNGTGPIGIQVLQASWQTDASASTANRVSVSGQGVGVQIDSDGAPSDLPGTFAISNSQFLHSNATALTNNSATFTTSGNHNS
jgi:hypothetical protein